MGCPAWDVQHGIAGIFLRQRPVRFLPRAGVSIRIKHDTTLSEAYTLFRMQDSAVRLRTLLRRRWGITFQASSSPGGSSSSSSNNIGSNTNTGKGDTAIVDGVVDGVHSARDASRGSGRWSFNVNHRHGIYEGNTMLNFAGEWLPFSRRLPA